MTSILMSLLFAAALYMTAAVVCSIRAERNATFVAVIASVLWGIFYRLG